jgi:magnesium chelatase family protein
VFLGELSLDGAIKPVNGILAAVSACRSFQVERVVVPLNNLAEAQLVSGMSILGFDHLTQVASEFGNSIAPRPMRHLPSTIGNPEKATGCFSEVLGQTEAIEALTVAAAGGHHVFMQGPPGAGKTMLASRFPTILPELTEDEAIEVASIRSIAKLEVTGLPRFPPFQAPHHTASQVSLVGGGGSLPKPGLISLAHNGVLFLDEAPEFHSSVLEAMRQPLESGRIVVSRASGHATFPASFQLLLAANPCPCGFAIGSGKQCICTASARIRYQSRISGPLADRIDLQLVLNSVNACIVGNTGLPAGQTSLDIQRRVVAARSITSERLSKTPWFKNAQVPGTYLRKELRLPKSATNRLDTALDKNLISMRGYDRCLRVAWSLADLASKQSPDADDLATAMYLRGSEI